MFVKDLIEKLSKFPENSEIFIECDFLLYNYQLEDVFQLSCVDILERRGDRFVKSAVKLCFGSD